MPLAGVEEVAWSVIDYTAVQKAKVTADDAAVNR
jgi:hypothetical protein